MEILTLWPLSQGEIEGVEENLVDRLFSAHFMLPRVSKGADTRDDLLDRVVRGGYPDASEE